MTKYRGPEHVRSQLETDGLADIDQLRHHLTAEAMGIISANKLLRLAKNPGLDRNIPINFSLDPKAELHVRAHLSFLARLALVPGDELRASGLEIEEVLAMTPDEFPLGHGHVRRNVLRYDEGEGPPHFVIYEYVPGPAAD